MENLLLAIAKEGKDTSLTGGAFVNKLNSASSVNSALKGLLEKDFITQDKNVYSAFYFLYGELLKSYWSSEDNAYICAPKMAMKS